MGLARIELEGRPAIRYDIASLDVGATVRGLERPGVRKHALATRPIRNFVDQLDDRLQQAARGGSMRIAVVGGGSAGVEEIDDHEHDVAIPRAEQSDLDGHLQLV